MPYTGQKNMRLIRAIQSLVKDVNVDNENDTEYRQKCIDNKMKLQDDWRLTPDEAGLLITMGAMCGTYNYDPSDGKPGYCCCTD